MKRTLLMSCLMTFNIMLSQMTVTPNVDAQDLILNSLIGNPNFPASNFVVSSGTNFGDVNGLGTFNYVGTNFNFDQGLVLSTGDVTFIAGPNINQLSYGSQSWPGDADLDALFGFNTNNASSLEFDFVADVESVSLDFLMASEEYDETFQCSFADTFAFILTNLNTGVSENLAVVPGTTTPIAVTTVHNGQTTACPAVNEAFFDRYNYLPFNSPESSPIDFNGQTKVFMLMGDLDIGSSYSIKIVIGDALDTVFDSALFVRNDSFGAFPSIDQPPVAVVVEDADENGTEVFDLTSNEAAMLGSVDTNVYSFVFTYHSNLSDAESGSNAISNPEAYTNTSAIETIFVRMTNPYTGTSITDSFQITIDADLLSVDDLELDTLTLYPNPVIDQLFIYTSTSQIENVEVYTITGQLVKTKINNQEDSISIDFSNVSNGLYLIKLTSENGTVYKRILK